MDNTPNWNDPEIPDEDYLFRRVLNRPDYFDHRDLLTGEPKIGRNAFSFDDDGLSVYRQGLMKIYGLSPDLIRRNSSYVLYKFTVGEVRKLGAGVIDSADHDDPVIGVAHSLVCCEMSPRPPQPQRRNIQDGLIAVATLVDDWW